VLQQLLLQERGKKLTRAIGQMRYCLTYEGDGVEVGDMGVEAQTLCDTAHLLSNIVGVASFGAIEDQGAAGVRGGGHGRCLGDASAECRVRRG
jgi:hypothetical protein